MHNNALKSGITTELLSLFYLATTFCRFLPLIRPAVWDVV
jgi:hypothetical protein